MRRDFYTTFIGAKGVAFAWVGAFLGPVFIGIYLEARTNEHLWVGIGCLVISLLCIRDGLVGFKHGVVSDFVAYTFVTLVLLVVGISLTWTGFQ